MPRVYKRKLGARRYKDYNDESTEIALKKIIDEGWSIRKAAKAYKIPYGTMNNKYNGRHIKSSGGQSIFSLNEEKAIIKCAAACGQWGFPLSLRDLRHMAKNLLDTQGRTIEKFENNLPGIDWAYSLLKRHNNDITQRLAANIKRARADVSREILTDYFNNLRTTLDGIPACNVYNYDETNLLDDPGRQKLIYHRGVKYPERVCNFTKSATSIMMCGSASGVLLPLILFFGPRKCGLSGPKMAQNLHLAVSIDAVQLVLDIIGQAMDGWMRKHSPTGFDQRFCHTRKDNRVEKYL